MTGDRVTEIKGRLAKVSSKNWRVEQKISTGRQRHFRAVVADNGFIVNPGTGEWNFPEDAELAANAPADLAYLLAELEGLRAKLANVEAEVARYDECPGADECCAEPLVDTIRAALHPNQEGQGNE